MKVLTKHTQRLHILAAEIAAGVLVNLLALGVFFKLSQEVFEKETMNFDQTIISLVYSWRSPTLTVIMKFITEFGGVYLLGGALVVAVIFSHVKRYRRSLFFLGMFATGIAINIALKNMFHRPRPAYLPLVHETSYSFPSGHAMFSFIFYMTLAYLYYHYTQNKKMGIFWFMVAGVMILLIGLSRVYLGAHYPSDVIGGYFGGLWWYVSVLVFEKILAMESLVLKRKN